MCSQIANMPSTMVGTTWRHNKVLKEVVASTKMAKWQNGGQSKFPQDCVAAEGIFLAGGILLPRKKSRLPPRRDILAEVDDWTIAADLEGLRHYPQLLRDSGRVPTPLEHKEFGRNVR